MRRKGAWRGNSISASRDHVILMGYNLHRLQNQPTSLWETPFHLKRRKTSHPWAMSLKSRHYSSSDPRVDPCTDGRTEPPDLILRLLCDSRRKNPPPKPSDIAQSSSGFPVDNSFRKCNKRHIVIVKKEVGNITGGVTARKSPGLSSLVRGFCKSTCVSIATIDPLSKGKGMSSPTYLSLWRPPTGQCPLPTGAASRSAPHCHG